MPVSVNCVLPTLEHSLLVGRAAILETGPLPPQDHKSGTVCRPISDYVGCHTARPVQAVTEDIFIRTLRPRHSMNCFRLRRIEIFLLTYLLTYLTALFDTRKSGVRYTPTPKTTRITYLPPNLLLAANCKAPVDESRS